MARYIIDTHTLIWWWDNSPRLSDSIRALLADRSNAIFVSAISALEMGIKVRLGKLPEMASRIDAYQSDIEDDGFIHLSCSPAHAVMAGTMAGDHRDPFDRMIAAQALTEQLTVIGVDREMGQFGCKVLW